MKMIDKRHVKKYLRKTFNMKYEILEVSSITKVVSMGITSYNISMKVKWKDNKYVRKHFHYIFTSPREDQVFYFTKLFGAEFYENERISDISFIRDMRLNELGI